MTKEQLLQKVSEIDIFRHYVPNFSPNKKRNYKSPFVEKDDKPSLSIYRDGSAWKFKSLNTGHQGDVFQFVAYLNKIDCKKDFKKVVEIIAADIQTPIAAAPEVIAENKSKNVKISYEPKLTQAFLNYFAQFKISAETLDLLHVSQVKYHEFISSNGKLCKFDYRKDKKIAVCYSAHNNIKIYFPKIEGVQEKSFGFKNFTKHTIFGKWDSKTEKPVFIAAGEKDCLALISNGFEAISFQSETVRPTQQQIDLFKGKTVFIAYDNDEAGWTNAETLKVETGWKIFQLPMEFKDVAEFFKAKTAQDFEALIHTYTGVFAPTGAGARASTPVQADAGAGVGVGANAPVGDDDTDEREAYTIFHQTEKYLKKRYDLRFNSIKLELEISFKNEHVFKPLNENSLFVELNKAGVKVGMDKLIAILKSDFVENYNPLITYFKNLPKWDGKTDYIQKLCDHIECQNHEQFSMQFAKWMMRAVKCATIEGYYNKQAFIIVQSKQNSGKTSFCRFLNPPALAEYFAENISDDKDSRIAIAKNFIINLDELSSLHRSEINSLKSLFSKDIINERLPYDRKTSIIHRVSSFIGSTNMAEFLTDETGSVRWLCFEIKGIKWDYRDKIKIDQCWAQAVGMIKAGYSAEMDRLEIEENEQRNSKFQQLSAEAEIIPQFLKPSDGPEIFGESQFLSATEVLMYLSAFTTIKLNKINIGRAMPLCGFHRTKDSKTDRYGYWCIKLK